MTQTLTVEIPTGLYARLQKRAEQTKRSVEVEVLEVLTSNIPATDELPSDLVMTLAALDLLDDAALVRAADSRLPAELAAELESLHFKQQREGLTEAEAQRTAELVRAYERAMLIRAQAAAILKKRGVEVPNPAAIP